MIAIDSSTLILLAKLDILDITITNIKEKLVITEEVYREVSVKKDDYHTKLIQKRVDEKKILKEPIKGKKVLQQIKSDFNLGSGEAETIALCLEKNIDIIIDDKKGINTCKLFRLKFITAPNIILSLYNKKIITKADAQNNITKLREIGRYSEKILQQFMEEIK